jgi:hypothetical protein
MNNLISSRKIVWPTAIVLVALWFLPTILHTAHVGVSGLHPAPQGAVPQPTPQPAPETVKPSPAIPTPPEDAVLKTLPGFWTGQELLTNRGICSLMFVLKEKEDKPGQYTGNTTGSCVYAPAAVGLEKPRNAAEMMAYMAPTSAILSGTADKGVLHFTVDKVFGNNCPPATFTFTPFAAQLAAEWTDSCGGGHIMLNRKTQ